MGRIRKRLQQAEEGTAEMIKQIWKRLKGEGSRKKLDPCIESPVTSASTPPVSPSSLLLDEKNAAARAPSEEEEVDDDCSSVSSTSSIDNQLFQDITALTRVAAGHHATPAVPQFDLTELAQTQFPEFDLDSIPDGELTDGSDDESVIREKERKYVEARARIFETQESAEDHFAPMSNDAGNDVPAERISSSNATADRAHSNTSSRSSTPGQNRTPPRAGSGGIHDGSSGNSTNVNHKATYRNRQQEEADPDFRRGARMVQQPVWTNAGAAPYYPNQNAGRGYYPQQQQYHQQQYQYGVPPQQQQQQYHQQYFVQAGQPGAVYQQAATHYTNQAVPPMATGSAKTPTNTTKAPVAAQFPTSR